MDKLAKLKKVFSYIAISYSILAFLCTVAILVITCIAIPSGVDISMFIFVGVGTMIIIVLTCIIILLGNKKMYLEELKKINICVNIFGVLSILISVVNVILVITNMRI